MKTNKNRGWQHVLLVILPYIIIVGGFQFLGMLASRANLNDIGHFQTSFQQLIAGIFELVGTLILFWLFMRFVDKLPFMKLGFHLKKRRKDIAVDIGLGLVIMTLGFGILAFAKEIRFSDMHFDLQELLVAIAVFIIVAFVEEALLRGYVLLNLMISFNKYIALLISSVLFSLMHASNPGVDWYALVIIFLAGILLGISYIYQKPLVPHWPSFWLEFFP